MHEQTDREKIHAYHEKESLEDVFLHDLDGALHNHLFGLMIEANM